MNTMQALVKREARPGLWLDEVPVPEIGINDVLIRVDRTWICGTDLHIYNWDAWAQKTIPVPMTVGHEFVGEIVAVGANVHDFFPGDVVSGEGMWCAAAAATASPAGAIFARRRRALGSIGQAPLPSISPCR